MSDKQQIKEMARDLVANWEWMSGYDDYNDGDIMDTVATCKKMHEQGYRKVVMCKNCKRLQEIHYEEENERPYIKRVCKLYNRQMQLTDFCSYGELKEQ